MNPISYHHCFLVHISDFVGNQECFIAFYYFAKIGGLFLSLIAIETTILFTISIVHVLYLMKTISHLLMI